jgi:hypothetical protein
VPEKSLTIEQILTILSEGPTRIAEATAGLTPSQLRTASYPHDWSANDVLAHLRTCGDIWGNGIVAIVTGGTPTLRDNPRIWGNRFDYLEQQFLPSFDAFTKQRSDLLAVLKSLTPEGWSLSATVMEAGAPIEITVLAYADQLARQEQMHVKMITHIANIIRE